MKEIARTVKNQVKASGELNGCYGVVVGACLSSLPNYPYLSENVHSSKQNSFRFIAQTWLEYKKPYVKKSTYVKYHTIVNKHILPCLGYLELSEIIQF